MKRQAQNNLLIPTLFLASKRSSYTNIITFKIILDKNKQKIIMSRFQTVYAISSQGYFNTSRPFNHPTIIRANQRNVHLGYVKCNQIFKGQSSFKDPKMEEFYKSSRSMPAKSQMSRSQITTAETYALDQSAIKNNLHTPNIKQIRRTKRLVSRSVHLGSSTQRIERCSDTESNQQKNQKPIYDFEQTMKVKIPLNISEFESFKSETLNRQVSTPHFNAQSKNYVNQNLILKSEKIPKLITDLSEAARLQNSYHSQNSERSNLESSRTYTIKSYINNEESEEKNIIKYSQSKLNEENGAYYNNAMVIKLNRILDDKYKQPQQRVEEKINQERMQPKQIIKTQYPGNPIKVQSVNGIQNGSNSITRITLNKQNEIQYSNRTNTQVISMANKTPDSTNHIKILEEHDNRKIISLAPSYFQNKQTKVKQAQTNGNFVKNIVTPSPIKNEEKISCFEQAGQSQLRRLKLELEKKERELKQCKNNLQISQKKNKSLEIQMKKLETNHQVISQNKYSLVTYPSLSNYSSQKNANEINKQLGGTAPALLYLTLLMVFLAKDMTGI